MISLIRRRWRTILICLFIGGLGAYLYSHQIIKVYQAVAEIEFNQSNRVGGDCCGEVDPAVAAVAFSARIAKHVLPLLEKKVVAEFRELYSEDKHSIVELTDFLRNDVSWSRDPKTDITRITGESSDPEFVVRMVNVLAHCVGSLMIQESKAMSDKAVKWLNEQVEERRVELDAIERQLVELHAESKASPAGSLEHEERRSKMEHQREEANEILRNVERRVEEARMAVADASIRVVREAEMPIVSTRPQKLIALLGSFLGAGFGYLLALLMELWGQRTSL